MSGRLEALAEPGQVQGSGEGLGGCRVWQSQVKFNRVPEGSGEGLGGWRLWQSQVRFNRVPPGQVQQGSGEGFGEGSARLWCRARSCSRGFAAI